MSLPLNQVLRGDCVEVMQGFPDNSVDLVVTDPPYGLSFMGKEWDKALPPKEAFQQMLRVLKPGALAFVMSSPRQDLMWRMMRLLEEAGFELRQSFISWVYKTGFPKAYDVSKGIDAKKGLKQKQIGTGKSGTPSSHNNMNIRRDIDNGGYEFGGEFPITEPASDEAKQGDGWKSITGLKPALEPILMVNKPLSENTIVDNVLRWGTGAMNVDACRIPLQNESPRGSGNHENDPYFSMSNTGGNYTPETGRFPANLLVSNGALNTGEITKAGLRTPSKTELTNDEYRVAQVYGKYYENRDIRGIEDIGDQSRYFDLDAWAEYHGILDVPKPDTAERDYGLKGVKRTPKSKFNLNDGSKEERFDGGKVAQRRNTHPTVKPVRLMAYLIELGCPKNGIVLDPFVGSGTTCIAAKQLGRKYIGIELDEGYCKLAEARIAAYPMPLSSFTR